MAGCVAWWRCCWESDLVNRGSRVNRCDVVSRGNLVNRCNIVNRGNAVTRGNLAKRCNLVNRGKLVKRGNLVNRGVCGCVGGGRADAKAFRGLPPPNPRCGERRRSLSPRAPSNHLGYLISCLGYRSSMAGCVVVRWMAGWLAD